MSSTPPANWPHTNKARKNKKSREETQESTFPNVSSRLSKLSAEFCSALQSGVLATIIGQIDAVWGEIRFCGRKHPE
jgi:hypothetical protein